MRRSASFILVAAVLSLALPAFTQTLPQGVQKVASIEGITEYAFPNGLHLLLFPDPSKPKVTVNVTYLVGSRHEGYGETGMAHLLEHLMFLQTTTRANIKQELTEHGAAMNGSTSWDRTNYFETVNASDENLRWALELEADRMVNTRMEKAILDKEMTVVRNEFESGENNPTNVMIQRILETAYLWHNYGHLPIGNRSDIENVPIDRLAAFYQKYYQPDDAVLTIAGKLDESKTLQWVADTMGHIPRPSRKLEKTYTVEPTQDGERTVTLRRVGDTQTLAALYHVPAATHPDTAAIQVLAGVLGDTPSGRLYKALVDNKKAVQGVMINFELRDPGVLIALAILRQEQSLDDARQTMLKTVEGLVNEPPTKEEVDRVKTRLLKQIDLAMTNTQSVALALSEVISEGDWRLMFYQRDEVKKVTPQDVLRVAKAYLLPSNRTLGEFIPTKSPERSEIPSAPDLTALLKDYKGGEVIAQGEAFDTSPANIESRVIRAKLANGMKLVLVSKKNRGGIVTAQLGIRFGDPKSVFGKSAEAQMAGALLMRGTKNKSRQQIQDESDRLKAQINVSGNATGANANIQTVEANLAGALRLAAELLREPAFPENEFEQVRQQRLAGIENARSEPQVLGSIELERHLRPYERGDTRYVSTLDEEIEEIKNVKLDEARKFYAQFYGASNAELVIVGQFDPAAVQKLAAELFGQWKSPSRFERVTLPYSKVGPMERKIETPDKQNAQFLAGMNTRLAMDDPDYPAVMLANRIFGGTFSARLVHRIRDKDGLSYGVNSGFGVNAKDDGATFTMSAICAPQNLPKVDVAFREELARALKDGFTAEEVAAEKKAWLEQLGVGRSTDGALAGVLLTRERFDRTMKFDAAMEAKIATLTVPEVNEAFRHHVDPATLSFVKAGDFKKAGVLQ
ncbi:MAG TPA: pitrilysin family protein [Candidatus Acidoferrales bacterium]|jgi:zinc protease|nr:pitrilysin family protein [Candidatus Acidoferrales bacterium]